jgi:hypothetical protein
MLETTLPALLHREVMINTLALRLMLIPISCLLLMLISRPLSILALLITLIPYHCAHQYYLITRIEATSSHALDPERRSIVIVYQRPHARAFRHSTTSLPRRRTAFVPALTACAVSPVRRSLHANTSAYQVLQPSLLFPRLGLPSRNVQWFQTPVAFRRSCAS